jgi:anti-anti-sigma factor
MSDDVPSFDVRCDVRDGIAVVTATGEIDLATSPELREALRSPDCQAGTVVLDLRGVTFMDSSGLGVIVGQNKRAREDGFRFVVAVAGAPEVERILELSGLASALDIRATPDDLLA